MSEHTHVVVGGTWYPIATVDGVKRFVEDPEIRFSLGGAIRVNEGPPHENRIVRWLQKSGPSDLNQIAFAFSRGAFGYGDDAQRTYAEFYMLIGYSISGFLELSFFLDMEVDFPTPMEELARTGEE